MGGLLGPSPLGEQQSESNMRPILLGVALVVVVVTVIVLLNRATPKGPTAPPLLCSTTTYSPAATFVRPAV